MAEGVNEILRFFAVFTNVLWTGCKNDNSRQRLQLKKKLLLY